MVVVVVLFWLCCVLDVCVFVRWFCFGFVWLCFVWLCSDFKKFFADDFGKDFVFVSYGAFLFEEAVHVFDVAE